jgi:hypothetical protein
VCARKEEPDGAAVDLDPRQDIGVSWPSGFGTEPDGAQLTFVEQFQCWIKWAIEVLKEERLPVNGID